MVQLSYHSGQQDLAGAHEGTGPVEHLSQGSYRIAQRSFSEDPVMMVYQELEALN